MLGIDDDEDEDTRSREIWATSVPAQKEFAFFPFIFSFPTFNNQKCDLVGLKNMNALVSW